MTWTVVHFTDSAGFGGAEQALLHVLAGLDRCRWRSILMHHTAPGLTPLLDSARDLDVELYPVPPLPLGWAGAIRVPSFMRELRSVQPTVFHAHLTWPLACKYALAGAVFARIPAIVATAQLYVDCPYDTPTRLQQRLLACGIHRYLAVSEEVKRRFKQTFHIPASKFRVVYNGIPLDEFAQHADPVLRATLTGGTERPIILTSARLESQKGHRYLLEAVVGVPDALLVLAGDGPARTDLEAQARALGIAERVIFLGYRQDIAALLACCDLFVLPSLFEGLPLSVLEAMAAGKPVIATAIGGTDEAAVQGETAILVPPADPAALGAAIRAVLADPILAQRLAAGGKARAARFFSTAKMVQDVTAVYEGLLVRRVSAYGSR